ncbi:MAG: YcxB family protein [Brevefilum sp.]
MEKELVFAYQPEKRDYIKASRTLALKTASFIIMAIVIFLLVIGSAVVIIFPNIGNASWRSAAFVGLAMGAFYLVNFWLIIPYQLTNAYKRNENLRKERKLTISGEGVTLQIGERATEFSWENFQRVIENNGFYLMIYKAEERVYLFLPERAFEDESSEKDFLTLLEEKSISVK